MAELLDRRTLNSKTFEVAQGKLRLECHMRPVHVPADYAAWKRGEKVDLKDADLALRPDVSTGKWKLGDAFYDLELPEDAVGYNYLSKSGGWVRVKLVELDGNPVGIAPAPKQKNNRITWENVAKDFHCYIDTGIDSVALFKRLESDQAPRSIVWEIEESDPQPLHLNINTLGWDNADFLDPVRAQVRPVAGRRRRWVEVDGADP